MAVLGVKDVFALLSTGSSKFDLPAGCDEVMRQMVCPIICQVLFQWLLVAPRQVIVCNKPSTVACQVINTCQWHIRSYILSSAVFILLCFSQKNCCNWDLLSGSVIWSLTPADVCSCELWLTGDLIVAFFNESHCCVNTRKKCVIYYPNLVEMQKMFLCFFSCFPNWCNNQPLQRFRKSRLNSCWCVVVF